VCVLLLFYSLLLYYSTTYVKFGGVG
jgi:hypothetical protein